MMKASASFRGFFIIYYNKCSLIGLFVDSIQVFHDYTRETVKLLSRVSGEVLQKQSAAVSQIFSSAEGSWLTVPKVTMKWLFYYPIV